MLTWQEKWIIVPALLTHLSKLTCTIQHWPGSQCRPGESLNQNPRCLTYLSKHTGLNAPVQMLTWIPQQVRRIVELVPMVPGTLARTRRQPCGKHPPWALPSRMSLMTSAAVSSLPSECTAVSSNFFGELNGSSESHQASLGHQCTSVQWPQHATVSQKDHLSTYYHHVSSKMIQEVYVFLGGFLFTFYNCIVPIGFLPWEIQVAFPRESLLRYGCATKPTVHAGILVFP